MMERIFDTDNVVWRFAGRLVDFVFLTVLWCIFSLPIVTAGAATTALYYVVLKIDDGTEGYLFKSFKKAFVENFAQATRIWILMLILGGGLSFATWWYFNINNPVGAMLLPVVLILDVLFLMFLVYVFPLLSRCQVTDQQLFRMSFVMLLQNLGWSVFMVVIAGCVIAVSLFVAAPLLLISVTLIAYVHAKVFKGIFHRYHLKLEH